MTIPDADPIVLLTAFLHAHAQGGVPTVLMARGDELRQRLEADPPADPTWGRFLVGLGQICTELGDDDRASRCFLLALRDAARHGDHEAAVTAGFNQGVLQERRGSETLALAAYRTAAREGFRLGDTSANLLRCASRAVELGFAQSSDLHPEDAALAKSAWLLWLWSERHQPERLDQPLRQTLQRQLCALLLPEDPGELAAAWCTWPPHALTLSALITDSNPATISQLFTIAATAADHFLADDGGGEPYRLLATAAQRQIPEPTPASPPARQ